MHEKSQSLDLILVVDKDPLITTKDWNSRGDIIRWLHEERESSILNSTFNNLGGNVHWSLRTPEVESSGVDLIYLLLEEHGTLIL
jgi:hypothetical protein